MAGILACHGLAGLAAPGLLELRHVLHYAVHAVFTQRMRVGERKQTRDLVGLVLAPDLSPAQEQSLFRREAINFFRLFARYGGFQRHVSDTKAAVVRGVLTQREFAIQMNIVYCHKTAVFVNQALCSLLEGLGIFRCPPILKIACRIKLASLIIKPMGQLMSDDRADTAKIQAIIGLEV